MGIYERLGVRPVINATCHWTKYGGAVMWPQLIGFARAKEMLLTGDMMRAREAVAMGLINHAVPVDQVVTTLDPRMQELAQQSARMALADLARRNAHNAAVVVIDPRTAEILAMVGSADYNDASIDGQVNVALAPRQPGSALKPIVYATTFMEGWSPATISYERSRAPWS